MSDELTETNEPSGVSRRLFAGLGAAAGASALMATLPGGHASAAGLASPRPEVLGATNPALTYLPLDAYAFDTDTSGGGQYRIYQVNTGVQPVNASPAAYVSASLPLPVGSTIYQLNAAFLGTPIVEIYKRSLVTPTPYNNVFVQTLTTPTPNPRTQTIDLATPVTTEAGCTYALRIRCTPGDSILGVTVGYLPPTQSFVPFSGPTPRILDTRDAGGKLAPSEERTVELGFAGVRGAVINLTVTETVGAGFVAVFPANVGYPGNSSINWTTADQNVANGVITSTGLNAAIKIRGGANATHVVIDRIGWLV